MVHGRRNRHRHSDAVAPGALLPTVLPNLSLIIGVLVHDSVRRADSSQQIDRFLFRLTAALSCAYLLAVLLVLLLQPLAQVGAIELMTQANVWLGPLQGLVAAAMAAFFVQAAGGAAGRR
jgi:hypothetical protein